MASQRSQVQPFRVMQMLDRVQRRRRAGRDTIMLCAGQPATGAPSAVLDLAERELRASPLGYTEVVGDRELREIVAGWHSSTYGVTTPADNVIITTGSSGGFVAAFLAVLDHGDTVALSCPGYPAYRNILEAFGARIVDLVCDDSTRFQPTAAMLEALPAADKPRAVIITSPGNPTGTIIDPSELERIARWCDANGAVLISDEDYHGMSFGRELATARQFSDRAVTVGTLSKYFSMTGWRVGWLIVPDELVTPIENLQASLALSPPAISQVAGRAAFSEAAKAELDGYVADYRRVRDVLLEELPKIGLGHFAEPDGGLYLWLDVSSVTDDSEAWCGKLVEEIGVAFAPGIDFDPVHGNGWVRLSLCVSPSDAREACRRLGEYLGR
ncbi:aspartate aminotransferase [Corynebacterium halotolerans YIM 70093 = DSM 44683]|uniref:Aspartate aminotransferase n=2 Tax=Corynebacterium halotolerans TaxID=225326 RepID=M1NPS3_9CORY|nr:aspartate aminotransferase [Corynebacterium halotolerans YIM 70093 = DSM 44683]